MAWSKRFLIIAAVFFFSIPAFCQVYEAWVQTYNGPADDDDEPRNMTVDDSGNIYVAGWSMGVNTYYDFATIKYTPDGDTAWIRRYNWKSNLEEIPKDIEVDQAGNVYVTGYSRDSLTGMDMLTIKYDPAGETLWARRYNGPANGGENVSRMEIGPDGSIYITGSSEGSGSYAEFCTVKYTPDGDLVWVRALNGPANWADGGEELAFDQDGNAYVSGITEGIGSGRDVTTIKYSPEGELLWYDTYNNPSNDHDFVGSLNLDGYGNVYVSGTSKYYSWGIRVYILKYSGDGDILKLTTYNGLIEGDGSVGLNRLDSDGNLVAIGHIGRSYAGGYLTSKFNGKGEILWTRIYDNPVPGGDYFDGATSMVLDDYNNIYVTGYSAGFGVRHDFATAMYSPAGKMIWLARFNIPPDYSEEAYTMALDQQGNIYVSGITEISTETLTVIENFVTVKYSPCPDWVGDLSDDHSLGIADIVYLVNVIFKSWQIPKGACLADVDNSGMTTLSDVMYLVDHIFHDGYPPVLNGKCCPSMQHL